MTRAELVPYLQSDGVLPAEIVIDPRADVPGVPCTDEELQIRVARHEEECRDRPRRARETDADRRRHAEERALAPESPSSTAYREAV